MSSISGVNQSGSTQGSFAGLTLERNSLEAKEILVESDRLGNVAEGAFFLGGFAGGVAASFIVMAQVVVGLIALASLATPIGWAALGLLGIGLTVLAIRNYIKENPETFDKLKSSIGFGVGGFIVGFLVIPSLFLTGGMVRSGGGGFGEGSSKNEEAQKPGQTV